jgi:hypothetical protein
MEEIIESIINGQRRQAIEQLKESSFGLDDLFEKLIELNMQDETVKMLRVAINIEYLIIK